MKKKKALGMTIAIATCLILVLAIIRIKSNQNLMKKISDLKIKTAPKFDSLSKIMGQEIGFQNKIIELISSYDTVNANKLIDSAIKQNPTQSIFYTYKGMIYIAENNPYKAIAEYNLSLNLEKTPSPLALVKRGEAYIKIKKIKDAIADFRVAASINPDYFYQLAQAFEMLPNKDSALKYYILFRNNYPTNKAVNKKIKALH
jgi:tetratricopeptide (TPR) repeat protein